jgi:hypothetical protein
MSNEDWVWDVIAKAREQHIAVPDAVLDLFGTLLADLGRRPMPAKDLANIAMKLIEAMGSVPQYPESLQ